MAHPNARDRTLVALAVQRGALSPGKVPRVLALCERLNQPADDVLPRWAADAPGLVKQGRGYRYRCGCRLWTLDELSEEPELRCGRCERPFVAEVSPDPLEESSVRGRPIPELLEETIRQPGRFAPTAAEAPAKEPPTPPAQPGFVSTRRDPYRGDRASPLPERIGPFEVEHQLGTGATGTVYLAKHPRGRPVAVKLLHPSVDAEALLRFQREVHLGRQLRHPGIVEVLDTGQTDDGQHFLVMDYVPGVTLRAKLQGGPLEPAEALRIVRQAAEAVAFLHEQDLIHRDLKPENLILDPARGRVRITDLGLARPVKDLSITDTGTVVGTPHYMSPEQLAGDKELDARTDVYALGVILYECLTGTTLYPDLTALALAARIFDDPPPRPANPELPEPLVAECLRALDPAPSARHAHGGELAYALACLRSLEPRSPGARRLHPALLVVIAILILVVAGVLLLPRRDADAPPGSPSASAPPPIAPSSPATSAPPSPDGAAAELEDVERAVLQALDSGRARPASDWDAAVARHPRDARPLHARAISHMAAGDLLRGYEDLARSYRLDPPPPAKFLDVCLPLIHLVGYERAAIDWQLKRPPDSPEAMFDLARYLTLARPPVQDLTRAAGLLNDLDPPPGSRLQPLRFGLLAVNAIRNGHVDDGYRLARESGLGAPPLYLREGSPPYLVLVDTRNNALLSRSLGWRLGLIDLDTLRRDAESFRRAEDRAMVRLQAGVDIAHQPGGVETGVQLLEDALTVLSRLGDFPALTGLTQRFLARGLAAGGRDAEALRTAEQALLSELLTVGERCDLWVFTARLHLRRGDRDRAEALLEQAHLAGPDDRRELEALQRELGR